MAVANTGGAPFALAGPANPTSALSASTEAVAPAINFLRRDLNETLCPELLCDILVPPKEIVNSDQIWSSDASFLSGFRE